MAKLRRVRGLPDLPPRPRNGHKGTFGTVIVVGGSQTMIGAPALCAHSAFRAGAGLVKIAAPAAALPFMLTIEPSATGIALSGSAADFEALLDHADPKAKAVLAIGPGMGRSDGASELVATALRGGRAIVLDADGLNALADSGRRLASRPASQTPTLVLTPHPGEFQRLARACRITLDPTDTATRPAAATALARAHRAVVVLKGSGTVVSDGDRIFVNTTGNPALATAGSGDVLTGLIAALMAQGLSGLDAAVLGVHLHGRAADLWARAHGRSGLTARDLATLIPDACHTLRRASRPST